MSKLKVKVSLQELLKISRARKAALLTAKVLKSRDEKRLDILTMTKQELQLFEEMSTPLALEDTILTEVSSKAAVIPKSALAKIERKSKRVLKKYEKKRTTKALAEKQLETATDDKEILRLNNVIRNNTLSTKEISQEKEIYEKRKQRSLREERRNVLEKSIAVDPFTPRELEDVA